MKKNLFSKPLAALLVLLLTFAVPFTAFADPSGAPKPADDPSIVLIDIKTGNSSAGPSGDHGFKLTDNKYVKQSDDNGGLFFEEITAVHEGSGNQHNWSLYSPDGGYLGVISVTNGGGVAQVDLEEGACIILRAQNSKEYYYWQITGPTSVQVCAHSNDFWLVIPDAPPAPEYGYAIEKKVSAADPDDGSPEWLDEVSVDKGADVWFKITVTAALANDAEGDDSLAVWLEDDALGLAEYITLAQQGDGTYLHELTYLTENVREGFINTAAIFDEEGGDRLGDDDAEVKVNLVPAEYSYAIEKKVSATGPDYVEWLDSVLVDKGSDAWFKITVTAALANGEDGAVGADSLTVWLEDEASGLAKEITLSPRQDGTYLYEEPVYASRGVQEDFVNTAVIFDEEGGAKLADDDAKVFVIDEEDPTAPIYSFGVEKKVGKLGPEAEGQEWLDGIRVLKGSDVWFRLTVSATLLNPLEAQGADELTVRLVDELYGIDEEVTLALLDAETGAYAPFVMAIPAKAAAGIHNVAQIFVGQGSEKPYAEDDATVTVYTNTIEGDDDGDGDLPGPDPDPDPDPLPIPDEQPPLASLPEAVTPETEGFTIIDEDTPLGNLPQTGTTASAGMGAIGIFAALISLAGAGLTLSKKEEA